MPKTDAKAPHPAVEDEETCQERAMLAKQRRKSLFPGTEEQFPKLWPPKPAEPANKEEAKRARIAVVLPGLITFTGYSPEGRFTAELISLLVQSGARPTVLDLSQEKHSQQNQTLIEQQWPDGTIYERVQEHSVPASRGPLAMIANRAYCLYEWLKGRDFDVVHSPDSQGCLYFCLRAKEQGLAFARCRLVVHPIGWLIPRVLSEYQNMGDVLQLPRSYMELRSLELADTLPVSGHARLRILLDAGATLCPERLLHYPLVYDSETAGKLLQGKMQQTKNRPPSSLLCLPGASSRGIALFCKALNRQFSNKSPAFQTLEFGIPHRYYKQLLPYIKILTSNLPLQVNVLPLYGLETLQQILSAKPEILCVLPVLDHWNHYQLRDLAAAGAHVLVADPQNAAEILDQETIRSSTCEQLPDAIAASIDSRLQGQNPSSGLGHIPPVPAVWIKGTETQTDSEALKDSPLVTVCIMHFERPQLLEQALASVEEQTYRNLEVVLVDDGSLKRSTLQKLQELETYLQQKGWKLIRQENRFLGAARNTAAIAAQGKYLFFLDDDNILKPNALEILVKVAEYIPADVVASLSDAFEGQEPPGSEATASRRIIQIGDDLSYGIFKNSFADSNALIRRSAFMALGGNTEDYAVGKDDQEFFARAVLHGYKLTVVPEALYWARQAPARLRHLHFNPKAGHIRVSRAYLAHVPPQLRPLLLLSTGLMEVVFEGGNITLQAYLMQKLRRIARSKLALKFRLGLLGPIMRRWRERQLANRQ